MHEQQRARRHETRHRLLALVAQENLDPGIPGGTMNSSVTMAGVWAMAALARSGASRGVAIMARRFMAASLCGCRLG